MADEEYKSRISRIIFGLWCAFLIFIFVLMREQTAKNFLQGNRYIRLMELLVIIAIALEAIIFILFYKKWDIRKKSIVIFSVALITRLIFLPFTQYQPSSDFKNYFNGACHFAEYGFATGAYSGIENYGIHTFAGQVIINGMLLKILSPTLLGMQLLNSIYTAGICLLIYLLGKEKNEKAAIIGAVFYTFYPSSILSTQITTNHHGATFFILTGIFFYSCGLKNNNRKKKVFYFFLCAVNLVLSNYYHPSVVIVLCALFVYMLMEEISIFLHSPKVYFFNIWKRIKSCQGILTATAFTLIIYALLFYSSLYLLKSSGYIKNNYTLTPLSKIVVGLNFESEGSFNVEDGVIIKAYPQEEQAEVCIRLVKERLASHSVRDIMELLITKTEKTWFGEDNYFSFYRIGYQNELCDNIGKTIDPTLRTMYERKLNDFKYFIADLNVTNVVFVNIMWLLAIVGMISFLYSYKDSNILYLLMYIPLGWMAFIMIAEYQPRYRYQGMSVIILLAGYGANTVGKAIIKYITSIRISKEQER